MARVGFLGLGIMGSRMAANLVRAGHELTVWTRTDGKAAAWAAEHRAEVAATPAEAAAASDVVISMVVDASQVRSVLLGEDGAADGAAAGTLCVDMSTIGPQPARAIGAELAGRGLRFLDAPVTGSSPKAADGTLTIMAGGEAADMERARPLLEAMGTLIVHVGPLGQGQMLKLINNAVAAANTVTVAHALLLADATGVDVGAFQQVLAAGSGGSAMLDLKGPVMRAHDYTTLFKTEHMLKDVRLCLDAAAEAGVPFPPALAARDALAAAMEGGHGADDFAAVLEAVETLAGRRLGDGPR